MRPESAAAPHALGMRAAIGRARACRDPGCGRSFAPRFPDQVFCSGVCRTRHHNRRLARGLAAVDALTAWVEGKPGAFRDLARLARSWHDEDRQPAHHR